MKLAARSVATAALGIALSATVAEAAPSFGQYWNRGKAEITSYDLRQARYGEIHTGSAVLIFVTEPFNPVTQVKADSPADDSVQVLKLNMAKKFNTGIYPYSMLLSVFTPVDLASHPHTLKTTVSSQEWCGHTWTQLNWQDGAYRGEQRSYFESEGDREFSAGTAMLEDEVWTRIRIAPETLPIGDMRMIPSGLAARLRHRLQRPEKATASLTEAGSRQVYTLDYPELKRTLSITFDKAFPHRIEGWEETAESGWGPDAKILSTKAMRNKELMIDYWNHHADEDRPLRRELGLPVD